MTLFRTAAETAIRGALKLLRTGLRLLSIVVLTVADGLCGLYGSERKDELLIGTRFPPFPLP